MIAIRFACVCTIVPYQYLQLLRRHFYQRHSIRRVSLVLCTAYQGLSNDARISEIGCEIWNSSTKGNFSNVYSCSCRARFSDKNKTLTSKLGPNLKYWCGRRATGAYQKPQGSNCRKFPTQNTENVENFHLSSTVNPPLVALF